MDILGSTVITTEDILEAKSEIYEVYHDEDGIWQAFSQKSDLNKPKVITLQNLLELDSSIEKLLSMPKGYMARKTNSKWIITKND